MTHAVKMRSVGGEEAIQVMIELDMTSYCVVLREYVAFKRLIETERRKLDLTSSMAILRQENDLTLKAFEQSELEIYGRVQREKNELSFLVRGLVGETHGTALIELLKSQLTTGNSSERMLASQLELQDKPLVFECLESSFVELLKNSMDAIVDLGTQSGLRRDMHLIMHVQLKLLDNSIVAVSIKDNGGGFSAQYLDEFKSHIEEKKYLHNVHMTHKNHSPFYFGGRGLGIGMICGKLLDGVEVAFNRNVPIYSPLSCLQSRISIKNEGRGAELTLMSGTLPARRYGGFLGLSQNDDVDNPQTRPVYRGEYLLENGCTPSSSDSSSLCQHSFFSGRRPVEPLCPAALIEADLALSLNMSPSTCVTE